MTVKTRRTKITPKMAERWLEANTLNRSLRRHAVAKYASDIREGRWQFTGDAIRFNCDGTLIDGQHRLAAIVSAGAPIEAMVITGLPRDIQVVVDTGIARTLGDALRLSRDVPAYHTGLAAVIRWSMKYEAGQMTQNTNVRFSVSSELEWYDKHPESYENTVWATKIKTTGGRLPIIGISLLGGMRTVSPEPFLVEEFFEGIAKGIGFTEGDPRMALRRWLERRAASPFVTGAKAQAYVAITAYNAFVTGRTVSRLRFDPSSTVPVLAFTDDPGAPE